MTRTTATAPRPVSPIRRAEAKAWLRGRVRFERRLAELRAGDGNRRRGEAA